jgi:hypothetical protein
MSGVKKDSDWRSNSVYLMNKRFVRGIELTNAPLTRIDLLIALAISNGRGAAGNVGGLGKQDGLFRGNHEIGLVLEPHPSPARRLHQLPCHHFGRPAIWGQPTPTRSGHPLTEDRTPGPTDRGCPLIDSSPSTNPTPSIESVTRDGAGKHRARRQRHQSADARAGATASPK